MDRANNVRRIEMKGRDGEGRTGIILLQDRRDLSRQGLSNLVRVSRGSGDGP